jgi:hypothetical protein
MKKIILFFVLIICSQQFFISQSRLSLGLGVGNQFGIPGIRASYLMNKIEGSLNFGINNKYTNTGASISYLVSSKELLNNRKTETFLSYHLGLVLLPEFDGYNNYYSKIFLHSLTCNYEEDFLTYFRWRLGIGLLYGPSAIKYKLLPTLSFGIIVPIWKKEK